jgi:hypothetical protein
MKSFESFQNQLDQLDTPQGESSELRSLQKNLQDLPSRSEQHQVWAWTRLREELRTPAPAIGHAWKRYFLPVLTGATALLLIGLYLNQASSDLRIEKTGDDLYSATFVSDEAEVVWVTGYTYIPSSYSLK